jgi:hypothetical protein
MRDLGRSVVVGVGFAWGVARILRSAAPRLNEVGERLNRIELALEQITSNRADALRTPDTVAQKPDYAQFITRGEFAAAMASLEHRIDAGVEARFQTQSLSIGALKAMIGHTDRMLERVLTALDREPEGAEQLAEEPLVSSGV